MLVDESFPDLQIAPEDLEATGPGVSLAGATIPDGIPEQWETILRHNPRVRRPWEEPGSYRSPSEAANAIAWYAGAYGLSKEQAAAVLVAFYSAPGRKPLHRRKLELTLRTWAKGRARLEEWNRGAGNGEPPERDPTDPGPTASSTVARPAERAKPEEGPHLTDLGNAQRLVARHREGLRYSFPLGKWFAWDGRRWAPDETGEVYRKAKETVRAMYAEASQIRDEKAREALAKHALRSESDGKVRAMVSLARSEPGVPVLPAELDRDPWVLNVVNGTLNLRSGELRPHRREDYITKIAPVEYDPEAKAPTWEAFLDSIFPGRHQVVRFIQKAVGYSLTGDTREHALFFCYGGGSNGKTTKLKTLQETLGDYAKQAPPDLLMAKQGTEHPTGLADLAGARLVVCVEAQEGKRLAEALVKQMTGGDRVKARRMREDYWEYQPTHKIWLAANHKPRVRGTDYAIWRRIRLIPFTATFHPPDSNLEPKQDPALPEKLRAELPGILRWAIEGCLAWQREGLAPPDEVKAATEAYRAESDTLGAFIDEKCSVEPTERARAGDLYREYVKWCEENGERPESQRRFGERLAERGFTRKKAGGGIHTWEGIGLLAAGPSPLGADDAEIPF